MKKPSEHDPLPLDAILLAIGFGGATVALFIYKWRALVEMLNGVARLGVLAAVVLLPTLWVLNRVFVWSAPRNTPAKRFTFTAVTVLTIVGAIVVMFLGMAFFGGAVL